MARIYLGAPLQDLTGGVDEIELEVSTVRALIKELDRRYPGIAESLEASGFALAINGEIIAHPAYEVIPEDAEVHFIFAIQGG
ncbi:MAG: MoaD/ThiS family protein [SAR324 cluster bacterium]|nr:MoaD/ThiS family protein [SAR324 cluster bacterium]